VPLCASQIRTVPSKLPLATSLPSADRHTADTAPVCPNRVAKGHPAPLSHSRTVPSVPPLAINFPSADSETHQTAKTIAVLQQRGYVARDTDPHDARRKRLQVTALGFDVMREGEAIFDQLRDQWQQQIGAPELETFETQLAALVGAVPARFDTPGWIARDLGESV
jgi:hypothetical protein